jgi:hypothetical protein
MPDKIDKVDKNLGRLVGTMRSQKFKDAAREIETDPQALQEAKSNPKKFLKDRNVHIDDDMDIEVTSGSWSITFCLWGACVTLRF